MISQEVEVERQDPKSVAFLKSVRHLNSIAGRFMCEADMANPWQQRTVRLFSSPLRSLKTILLLPLVVVRVVGLVICFAMIAVLCSLAMNLSCLPKPKAEDVAPPMLPLRSRVLLYPAKFFIRGVLFFMGYQWVSWTGRPVSKSEAPMIVPNHVSWVETFYLTGLLWCSGMSKIENVRQPVVGSVLRALQFVLVDREDPDSRKHAADSMAERVHNPDVPPFLIFPEGMTSNGTHVLQFRGGPFTLGVPVQPVGLSFPFDRCCSGYDPSYPPFVKEGVIAHILRSIFELHNPMHVTWCDPYIPSEEEKKDSHLYANNVRDVIATTMGLPCTEHTLDNIQLMLFAQKDLKIKSADWTLVEMGKLRDTLHFDVDAAKVILQRFENVDTGMTGKVDLRQFLGALDLPRTKLTEMLFQLYDLNGDGEINFREYLCAQAVLRGITEGQRYENERAVSGGQLHQESLDFAWHILVGDSEGKATLEYEDIKNVFERYAMPTGDGAAIRRLFDRAKGDKPVMDREAFDAFMLSTPEYMQLFRLGERQRLNPAQP